MATAAQIVANQANALLSTGPTSQEGKARSALNSRKHGLYSRQFVVLPGQEADFDSFITGMEADLQPANTIETTVFRQIAQAAWTLRRCDDAEADLHARSADPTIDPLLDQTNEANLRRLDTCRRRAQNTFHRMLKELRLLQTERLFRVETMPEQSASPEEETVHTISPAVSFQAIHREQRADRLADRHGDPYSELLLLESLAAKQAKRDGAAAQNHFVSETSSSMLEVQS